MKADQLTTSFGRECEGSPFKPTREFVKACEIWRAYYAAADEYDNANCTGRTPSGEAVPMTPAERRLCDNFARGRAIRAENERIHAGVSDAVWKDAKRVVLREMP